MDPELDKELSELRYLIQMVSSDSSRVTADLNFINRLQGQSNTAVANNTTAQNNNSKGTSKLQQIMSEEDQKNKKFKDNIDVAFGHSVSVLTNFGSALVNSQTGLQKYSSTVESLGKGASALGDNFGILGKTIGGLLNLFGKFASSVLNLNQNTLNLRNNFAKAGGLIPASTERLGQLAKEAGFALDSMKTLDSKLNELSTSMTSLGGSAGEGALKFMQIANVEDSVRREFGRLGVSQDHLLNLQGLYLEMQKVSGKRMENENKSTDQMQKESLQYAKTLITLSSITGKNAEELQKEINSVMLEVEEQNQIAYEQAQIAKLKKEGKHAQAAEIQRQSDNRQKMIVAYTALYGRDMAMQAGRVARTGAVDTKSRDVAMLPIEDGIVKSTQRIINSENVAETLAKEADNVDNALKKQNTIFKDVVQQDPESAKNLGLFTDAIVGVNARGGEAVSDLTRRIIDDMDAKTDGTQEDQLADNIEGVRSFERESKKLFQTLLEFIDPMRNLTGPLTIALGVAAAALTGLAVVKIGKSLVGGLFGGLFERGGSSMKPNHIMVSGMPDLGGGSSAFAGSAADPTGLGLRKADLVDKHGNTLGGAALDARLKKISEERTPKTTSYALKQAAKNSGAILKGAATLAGAIATIGAGIAGATWLVGKAIPTFAGGMKKFNEVDGENLKGVGLGMAGLGVGILALAAEKIVGFMNVFASALGAQSPLERAAQQVKSFEKMDIDANKVERNGKAALAFARAFKDMPATSVSISGMLSGFFSGPEVPYDKFEKFAKFDIDAAIVENNSKAFIAFSNAMATYSGFGAIDGLGAITTALADSVVRFYQVDPPEKRFKNFSDLKIDGQQVGKNATAFKHFSEGMSKYKGPPGGLATISSLIGTQINKIFGADGPIEAFVKFSKDTKDIGPNAAKNARAFFNFARAFKMLTGSSGFSSGGLVSGFFGNIRARGDASDPTLTTPSSTGGSSSGSGSGSGSGSSSGPELSRPGPDSKVLDLIGKVESGNNYNILVGGKIEPQLTNMTIQEVLNFQTGMKRRGHESTAVGKYQIINKTLAGRVSAGAAKLTDKYDPSTQDKLAISLKNVRGREKFKQGKISVDQYADNLSKEWASLPYKTGRSFYDKVGSNKSLISRNELIGSLKAKEGGLFSGPTSGYPMELHGTELIVPVDSNSILMKLATEATSGKPEGVTDLEKIINPTKQTVSKSSRKNMIDLSRIESISSVLDRIVDVIDSTDDIDQKILRYAD